MLTIVSCIVLEKNFEIDTVENEVIDVLNEVIYVPVEIDGDVLARAVENRFELFGREYMLPEILQRENVDFRFDALGIRNGYLHKIAS